MNIMHIIHKNYAGGSTSQMRLIVNELSRRGHLVLAVVPDEAGWRTAVEQISSAAVWYFVDFQNIHMVVDLVTDLAEHYQIQVVHSHKILDLSCMLLATLKNPRLVIVANRAVAIPLEEDEIKLFSNPNVHHIVAVSKYIKGVLVDQGHISPYKVSVIEVTTDTAKFSPYVSGKAVRAEFNIPNDVPVVGMIANQYAMKRQDLLLRAARILVNECHSPPIFLFVGDPCGRDYSGLAEELGIHEQCRFAGFRWNIPEFIAAMNVTVLCSDIEGFGAVLLESLSMEVPVIATSVGGIPEVVENQVNGYLVPPGDHEALANAIAEIIRNTEKARRMGQNGRRMVQARFDIRHQIVLLENLYTELWYRITASR